jgi:hypothetical protein
LAVLFAWRVLSIITPADLRLAVISRFRNMLVKTTKVIESGAKQTGGERYKVRK